MKLRLLFLLIAAVFAINCTGPAQNNGSSTSNQASSSKRLKIGFAMDTLKEERWVRDRDAFEAHCKKMDVECVITVADNLRVRPDPGLPCRGSPVEPATSAPSLWPPRYTWHHLLGATSK